MTTLYIGDRRTKHPIRAFRSPGHVVVIPKSSTLHDVRTGEEVGYRYPAAMRVLAREHPELYLFEWRGETLYTHSAHPLMELTEEIEPEYASR
jgi:hypothetical protein